MKGVVFTEFFELVESNWGLDMVDDLIGACELESGGSYTAVGTYDHGEIVQLVQELSRRTEAPIPDLLRAFGEFLFARFVVGYAQFFEGVTSALDFLEGVENYIHVEVKKLYPDAMLPRFTTERREAGKLVMVYHSERHLHDLARGLIQGCCEHFEEPCEVQMEEPAEDGSVRFTISRS